MLSVVAGVILPVVSQEAGEFGRKQTAERARCSPEPEQLSPLAAGPLGLGFLMREMKSACILRALP